MSIKNSNLKFEVPVTSGTQKPPEGARLSPAAQASIGVLLRQYYAGLVEAPLPASLVELRRKLEQCELDTGKLRDEEPSVTG